MSSSTPLEPGLSAATRDDRRLAQVVHLVFLLLLGSALVRYLQRHSDAPNLPAIMVLSGLLVVVYLIGMLTVRPVVGPRRAEPGAGQWLRVLWLAMMVAVWAALVTLAPSFALCAVPVIYLALRILPVRAAGALVGLFTVGVVLAQLRLADRFDLDLVIAPPAVAALTTAVVVYLDRQAVRQRTLIDDLISTRQELAATERRAGTLTERQRLSMEIHDTLAQGLSSQQMLLQAADRVFPNDPGRAREHLRAAAEVCDHSLTEARRFVHDLAPADLAVGGSLEAALRRLVERESSPTLSVSFHLDGRPGGVSDRLASAIVRIAQGALANVREHAEASRAAVTLSCLGDEVRLDIADDGRGMDIDRLSTDRADDRGHGLPAIRARVRQFGGTVSLESAPGDGTVVSAAFPLSVDTLSAPLAEAP